MCHPLPNFPHMQAGIAGIAFPVAIVALIPLRMYLLPKLFHADLQRLDADEVV